MLCDHGSSSLINLMLIEGRLLQLLLLIVVVIMIIWRWIARRIRRLLWFLCGSHWIVIIIVVVVMMVIVVVVVILRSKYRHCWLPNHVGQWVGMIQCTACRLILKKKIQKFKISNVSISTGKDKLTTLADFTISLRNAKFNDRICAIYNKLQVQCIHFVTDVLRKNTIYSFDCPRWRKIVAIIYFRVIQPRKLSQGWFVVFWLFECAR